MKKIKSIDNSSSRTKPRRKKFWMRSKKKKVEHENEVPMGNQTRESNELCITNEPEMNIATWISTTGSSFTKESGSQVERADPESEHEALVKVLITEADETDNSGNIDLALAQYQAIRDYIAALPNRTGAIDAVDAKAAFSIGMIFENEKHDYRRAQKFYREALRFYSITYDMLRNQSKQSSRSRRRTQKIRDELNQRISAILLRLAVTSGRRNRWEQSLNASNLAYDTFLEVDGSNFSFSEDNKIRQRIEDQINLSENMLERCETEDLVSCDTEDLDEDICICSAPALDMALDTLEDAYLDLLLGKSRKKKMR